MKNCGKIKFSTSNQGKCNIESRDDKLNESSHQKRNSGPWKDRLIASMKYETYINVVEDVVEIDKLSRDLFSIPKSVISFIFDGIRNVLKFYLWIYTAQARILSGMGCLRCMIILPPDDQRLLFKHSLKQMVFFYFSIMHDLENSEWICKVIIFNCV